MITPLLPIFLTATLGAGPAIVGLVEGVAEAAASILKLISRLVGGSRLESQATRPERLRALKRRSASHWDRPRLAAGVAASFRRPHWQRSTHRAARRHDRWRRQMPTFAAEPSVFIAPWITPVRSLGRSSRICFSRDERTARQCLLLVRSSRDLCAVADRVRACRGLRHARTQRRLRRSTGKLLHPQIRAMVVAAGGLALASVPEVFVVLWAHDAGLATKWIPLLWACASLAKMFTSWPAGALSDQLGRAKVLAIGWSIRVALLLLIANCRRPESRRLGAVCTLFDVARGSPNRRSARSSAIMRVRRSAARRSATIISPAVCSCCPAPCSSAQCGNAGVHPSPFTAAACLTAAGGGCDVCLEQISVSVRQGIRPGIPWTSKSSPRVCSFRKARSRCPTARSCSSRSRAAR